MESLVLLQQRVFFILGTYSDSQRQQFLLMVYSTLRISLHILDVLFAVEKQPGLNQCSWCYRQQAAGRRSITLHDRLE